MNNNQIQPTNAPMAFYRFEDLQTHHLNPKLADIRRISSLRTCEETPHGTVRSFARRD
jgi:hypothetical protein